MDEQAVFLSYPQTSIATAKLVHQALDRAQIPVWDAADLARGENLVLAVEKALDSAAGFAVLVSPATVTSQWAMVEAGIALARHADDHSVQVVPVLVDGASMADIPFGLRHLQCVDANNHDEDALSEALSRAFDQLAIEGPVPSA